jgi:hypothetical protein
MVTNGNPTIRDGRGMVTRSDGQRSRSALRSRIAGIAGIESQPRLVRSAWRWSIHAGFMLAEHKA